MKLTATVKLLSTVEDSAALRQTVKTANECANWLSASAWGSRVFSQFALHKMAYAQARLAFPLSAQMVVRAICKVAIWTTAGRRTIAFVAGDRQMALLASRRGETDLILRRGVFYLAAICDVAEPVAFEPADILGVDLGVVNIASDSDGRRYSGSTVQSVRHRQRRLRAKLQRKHTTSAKRRLRKLAGKEQRFATQVNHVVSKQIVAAAKGTGRGIAIEQLNGIRGRITVGRRQRAVLHSWAFHQLRLFLEYKAKLAGIALVLVDPRNSSRECCRCHHVSKSNRLNQCTFRCRVCGYNIHADINAALNLRERGRAACKPATRGSRLGADRPARLPGFGP